MATLRAFTRRKGEHLMRLISFAVVIALTASRMLAAGERSNPSQESGGAVDAQGVRHKASDYKNHRIPGADPVKMIGPEYPSRDRRRHHEGTGIFQLTLDLKTGGVKHITTIKSTGFVTLDRSARSALAEWRWAPGKWKEITVPVTFGSSPGIFQLPPGAKLLPPQYRDR